MEILTYILGILTGLLMATILLLIDARLQKNHGGTVIAKATQTFKRNAVNEIEIIEPRNQDIQSFIESLPTELPNQEL